MPLTGRNTRQGALSAHEDAGLEIVTIVRRRRRREQAYE
jgi:hypothetical protein